MKRRVLSIDLDYYVDADLNTRNNKFPDGEDSKPKEILDKEWEYFYKEYPEIANIGLIDRFETLKGCLSELRFGKVVVKESHKDIKEVFDRISDLDHLEVVHIDFHHDCYISSGDKWDCANWVRQLMKEREQLTVSTTINWLRREDSEVESLTGRFPYPSTYDHVIYGEFDYIFICTSPEWTPPHLLDKLNELLDSVAHLEWLDYSI